MDRNAPPVRNFRRLHVMSEKDGSRGVDNEVFDRHIYFDRSQLNLRRRDTQPSKNLPTSHTALEAFQDT